MEGETNSAVRQLARRLPSFVAERPGPAVVDRVSQVSTYLLTYSLTHLLTYSLTYLLANLLTYSLTYLLAYLLTHLLTYLLTYRCLPSTLLKRRW